MMKVPFVNLKAQYATIKSDIDRAIAGVIDESRYIRGQAVTEFERRFRQLCDRSECIAMGNCTDALHASLKGLNIGHGDEVITPAFTWISSAEVIVNAGATPVFADVHPDFFTIDPDDIKRKISSRTKAVIIVHLYGQAAPVRQIREICDENKLFLIEDCAQAHLTEENNIVAGKSGTTGCFSFYPTKNLGAYGDAGCLVCDDPALAVRVRRFANHGGLDKNDHQFSGVNSRMDTIQAAILNAKLPFLRSWNGKRIELADRYCDNLRSIGGVAVPKVRHQTVHSFHLFVIKSDDRNNLMSYLAEKGIETQIHYPCALPYEPAYARYHHSASDFPVSASLQGEVLSLPIYPELTFDQVDYVCETVAAFYG